MPQVVKSPASTNTKGPGGGLVRPVAPTTQSSSLPQQAMDPPESTARQWPSPTPTEVYGPCPCTHTFPEFQQDMEPSGRMAQVWSLPASTMA